MRVSDPVLAAALSTVARNAVVHSPASSSAPAPHDGAPLDAGPLDASPLEGGPHDGAPHGGASGPGSLDGSTSTSGPDRLTRVLVTDRAPTSKGPRAWSGDRATGTVLVVGPTPYDARWALQAMATVPVHGVVPAQHPGRLADVLAALAVDVVQVPASVVELARSAPALTDEQHTLAELLVAGRSNPEICRVMGISQSGVKRRLSALFDLFEVDNRVQAAAVAAGLGIRAAAR